MSGRRWTDEARAKLSLRQKERFSDPKNHPRYGAHCTAETKAKIGKASTATWERKGKDGYFSEAGMASLRQATTARVGWKHTDATKAKISVTSSAPHKLFISDEELVALYVDRTTAEIGKLFGVSGPAVSARLHKLGIPIKTTKEWQAASPERKKYAYRNHIGRPNLKLSEFTRKANKDPEFIRKRLKGLCKRPTRPEKALQDLINEHNLPYRYVGDGQVLVGSLNPDFVNINGQKKAIEVFGDYWHRLGDSPLKEEHYRRSVFAGYGWEMLVIWESEVLTDKEATLQKVLDFDKPQSHITT